jgi:hypothetical protein
MKTQEIDLSKLEIIETIEVPENEDIGMVRLPGDYAVKTIFKYNGRTGHCISCFPHPEVQEHYRTAPSDFADFFRREVIDFVEFSLNDERDREYIRDREYPLNDVER